MLPLHLQKTSLAGDLCKRTMAICALLQRRAFEGGFDGLWGRARGAVFGCYESLAELCAEGDHTPPVEVTRGQDGFVVRELVERLRKIERSDPPFLEVPRDYRRGSRWAEPQLVAEIAYGNWTSDQVMRHPKFLGLREDKPAPEVRLE